MLNITYRWKYNSLLFTFILLICFAISALIRYQQLETWKQAPSNFFVGERPLMTTLDAPFWLRWAKEYNEGTYGTNSRLRSYPDQIRSIQKSQIPQKFKDPQKNNFNSSDTPYNNLKKPEIKYRDIPLLSHFIAFFAPFWNNNYYLTGTLLIPILASLFIIPLGIYFFKIGVPVSGLLGGLIGTFSMAYFTRSSIGRIDTDMLNLFFPILSALLILMASLSKKERSILLYSAITGFSLFLFHWWHSKTGYILVFFVVLIFCLFIHGKCFRTILISALLFALFSQPKLFIDGSFSIQQFLKGYFTVEESIEIVTKKEVGDNIVSKANFPNTMTTISEVDSVPLEEVLRRVVSNVWLAWAGLIAFFVLTFLRWKVLLPILPVLALGILSFKSSNRFIMYLAPFIGMGLGWLIHLFIEGILIFSRKEYFKFKQDKTKSKIGKDGNVTETKIDLNEIKKGSNIKKGVLFKFAMFLKNKGIDSFGWTRQAILYFGMGVFFWLISGMTAISFVPGPSMHPRIYDTFLQIKNKIPHNSALLTWWDYGYAITYETGLATLHDGGSQNSPKTYFIARGLISSEPDELYDIAQFLTTVGNRGIAKKNTSPQELLEAVRSPQKKPIDPIYLFFTADMTNKFGAISRLGTWDLFNGGSKPEGYQNLACNKITQKKINCRGAKIDLVSGKINNNINLRRFIIIMDGKVIQEKNFGHPQGFSLQLIAIGRQVMQIQLISETVFLSNYNQMFLLGRYRKDLFHETYNAFPFSRLYMFKF